MTLASGALESLRPGPRRPHRVVVLCSDGILERHTCATLVRRGIRVAGMVVCARGRLTSLVRWVARHGVGTTAAQIVGRLYDRALNARRDRRVLRTLVDDVANRQLLRDTAVPVIHTTSYSRPDTMDAIRNLDPDVFVVHTKYIVGPRVRSLAPVASIGGHPGITPTYRGSYSPFWALLHGSPHQVGCSVFLLDDGVDTGPILFQEQTPIAPDEDSHLTLAWKGMIRQAELQASALHRLDRGECLPLTRVQVPPNSYFRHPRLLEVLRYRRTPHGVR